MGHHSHQDNRPLSIVDVIAGFFCFILVAYFMRWLINNGVPGLLKEETFYQILQSGALFLAVWGLFLNNLFKKYVEVLELREEKTIGAEAQALKVRQESKDLELSLEKDLQSARIQALKQADDIIAEARKKAGEIIEAANSSADTSYAQSKSELEKVKVKLRAESDSEALNLARYFKESALKPSAQTIH